MTTRESLETFNRCLNRAYEENNTPLLLPSIEQFKSRRHVRTTIHEYEELLAYLKPNSSVLDFGTGLGCSVVPFAAAGHTTQAVDIDQNETPASIGHKTSTEYYTNIAAQQRVFWPMLEREFKSLHFSHYYKKLPEEFSQAFDVVNTFGVLEHVLDPMLPAVMEIIKSALKENGLLLIDYLPRKLSFCERMAGLLRMPRHERLWGDREAVRFLKQHGFKVLSFRRIGTMPLHPAWLSNQFEKMFDFIDACATNPPFDVFNHHMRIIAQKTST